MNSNNKRSLSNANSNATGSNAKKVPRMKKYDIYSLSSFSKKVVDSVDDDLDTSNGSDTEDEEVYIYIYSIKDVY